MASENNEVFKQDKFVSYLGVNGKILKAPSLDTVYKTNNT